MDDTAAPGRRSRAKEVQIVQEYCEACVENWGRPYRDCCCRYDLLANMIDFVVNL